MDEIQTVEEEHFIPGIKLPGYDDYCPITRVWGYPQEDGSFLADGEVVLDPAQFVDNPGFLVLHLGSSVEPEYTVESAAHALHSSLISLFASCGVPVDLERIRTSVEFSEFMKAFRGKYSNLILIGHGSTKGICFLDRPAPIQGEELAGMLGYDTHKTHLQILSLCCHSGCENISKALSNASGVTEVIAPSEAFDMRWAVHFVIGYFLSRYINDMTTEDAIQANCTASKMSTCIWRDGNVNVCNPPVAKVKQIGR